MAYNEYANAVRQSYVNHLHQMQQARYSQYLTYREYYDGDHHTQLTDRQEEFLQLDPDHRFSANYCHIVVNTKADRLNVIGFETESDQSDTLWRYWRLNRMDRLQGIVHTTAGRDGDSFVLVSWDNESNFPRFHYEPAYCGEGVMVYYSDENRNEIEFASKKWSVSRGANAGKVNRLNLYFPNRIEKYISNNDIIGGSYYPYEDPDNPPDDIRQGYLGMTAVYWLTDDRTETGNPIGVPVVHFKNNDTGGRFGKSDLADIIPLQNAVNKALLDLIANMDINGFGVWVSYLANGLNNAPITPGIVLELRQQGADLKRIEGENPDGLINAYNMLVMEIARISGVPLSYFQASGQVAAEGTLKQQEAGLLAKVKKAQIDYGNGWEQCMMLARRMHNAFNTDRSAPQLDETELIETVWDNAEIRDDKQEAETLAIKVRELGVSKETAQRELGYTDEEIAQHMRAIIRNAAMTVRRNAQNTTGNTDEETNQTLTETEANSDTE